MLVNAIENRRDPSKRIAFIKAVTEKHGSISLPAFFEINYPMPEVGEHEVMITGALFPKDANGHYNYDALPKNLFVRLPQDEILVDHEGFECNGSMCQTLSYTKINGKTTMITPGKMMQYLHVADNVNAEFDNREPYPLKPGKAYVARHPEKGTWRVVGVPSLSELNL